MSSTMQLELRSKENTFLRHLDGSETSLRDCGAQDGMIVHVNDQTAIGSSVDEAQVPKYEMSETDYESRTDSVLAWKKRNQLGRFNPEEQKANKERHEKLITESEAVAKKKNIQIGQRCEVHLPKTPARRGQVCFVGTVHFKPGVWVGVHYDEPNGKNDGSIDGKRYFTCPQNYGSFVRPQDLEVGDFPEFSIDDMDEL